MLAWLGVCSLFAVHAQSSLSHTLRTGLAVFDFEEWTNIWELMTSPGASGGWHSIAYQNYSVELERKAQPGRQQPAVVIHSCLWRRILAQSSHHSKPLLMC